jgi:hypothetical protein
VIPELLGVPVAGALLLLAADLADEAVDIDHQRSLSGAGARLPRPRERDIEDSVELADMPERERTQKRPERGRRHHPVPEDQARAPGSEHVHVIDAVRPGEHPVHQRHHLTARQARSRRPGVEPHRLVHQLRCRDAGAPQPRPATLPGPGYVVRSNAVGSVALADLGATANRTGWWVPGLAIVGLFLAGVWFVRPRPG